MWTNIEFSVLDADSVDVPEASFDAALCRWALMFLADLKGALRRILRALSPGGGSRHATVAEPAQHTIVTSTVGAILTLELPPPPAPRPNLSGFLRLSTPALVNQALTQAGFIDVRTERVPVPYEFESGADLAAMKTRSTQSSNDRWPQSPIAARRPPRASARDGTDIRRR